MNPPESDSDTAYYDSDNDGTNDAQEILDGTDPNSACSYSGYISVDGDNDGLSDCEEMTGDEDTATTLSPSGTSDETDVCDPDNTVA